MAKTHETVVRQRLDSAVRRLGGRVQVAAICRVSEQTVRNWLAEGNLNKTSALSAWRFIRADGRPLGDFVVPEVDKRK